MSNLSHSSFQQQQIDFAQAIRDPDSPVPEWVAEERMSIYRELFFNNIQSSLQSTFPVLHEVLAESQWTVLTRQFFTQHRSQVPEFVRLPGEFVDWLQTTDLNALPGYLLELAAWEWSELEVMLAPAIEMQPINPIGDLMQMAPQLNPTLRLHTCTYPVHQISAKHQPEQPLDQPVELLVLRTLDDEVEFIILNPTTAALIHQLQEMPMLSGHEQLQLLAQRLSMEEETLLHYGPDFFQQLRQQSILLGSSTVKENI